MSRTRFADKADAVAPFNRAAPIGLIEQLPFPLVVLDAEDCFTYASPAAEEFFQTSLSRLLGKPLAAFVAPDHPVLALIGQARRSGRSSSLNGLDIASPRIGEHKDVEVFAGPLADIDGTILLTLHERATARQLERQFGRRNPGRSVSGLASVIAHEIRNPLAGMRGAAQLLEPGLDADGKAMTHLICSEIDRIAGLLDRMLTFGGAPSSGTEPVNIHRVLDHVRTLTMAGAPSNLRISAEYDPSLPPVIGNRDRLVQAVLNLVRNAVDAATKHSDKPQIWLRTAFHTGVVITDRGTGQRVALPLLISVEDNGPGIPDEIVPHLFEPFVTSKPSGTGLGLALSAQIVAEHGGLIETERLRGRTIFRVLLPMAPNSEVPS